MIFHDVKGEAFTILPRHYLSSSETRVIRLYTEFTSLRKDNLEDLTDYILHVETAVFMLKKAGEEVSYSHCNDAKRFSF